MQKYLLFLAIVLISVSCLQTKKQDIAEPTEPIEPTESNEDIKFKMFGTILDQLNLKSEDCLSRFLSVTLVPKNENLTIWVIPKITFLEEDEYHNESFSLDSYILLADTETGKIVSKSYFPNKWSSDAYELMGIDIDTLNYTLNNDKIVFGICSYYQASTRVCPTGDASIELFVQEGDSLHSIFSYSAYEYHGENDGGFKGNSWMGKHKTNLIATENKTNGFSDFVLSTEFQSETTENSEIVANSISNDSLRFFSYTPNSYKEDKDHIKVFCRPLEDGKKDCYYYGKTLAEVYQIVYNNNNNDFQRYTYSRVPSTDSDYTMKYEGQEEDIDSIRIIYDYLDKNRLSVSFNTDYGSSYYIFEEKRNYTNFKYDYCD